MKFLRTMGPTWLAALCLLLTSSAQNIRTFKLEPLSPKFWDLVDRDTKLETVATGFGFTEGPMWDPSGFLYVSDETVNKIFRVFPDGKKEALIDLGDPDGNTFDRQHRLITSLIRERQNIYTSTPLRLPPSSQALP